MKNSIVVEEVKEQPHVTTAVLPFFILDSVVLSLYVPIHPLWQGKLILPSAWHLITYSTLCLDT